MQQKGLKYYSLFATMLFVLPVLLQVVKIQFGVDKVVALLTYLLIVVSFIYNFIDVNKRGTFKTAFRFDNSYKLDVFAYLVAVGFFVEFISNITIFVKCVFGENHIIITYVVPVALCSLFSLLSSLYFLMIGLSYGTKNYDFRSFNMFHIVIMLWCIFKLLTLFGQAISIAYDINGVLRYLSIIVISLFFYYFVLEVEKNDGANRNTVYFARMCAYCCGFYSLDRLVLLIVNQVEINSNNTYFAITTLFMCLFSLFFEKSIVQNTIIED